MKLCLATAHYLLEGSLEVAKSFMFTWVLARKHQLTSTILSMMMAGPRRGALITVKPVNPMVLDLTVKET